MAKKHTLKINADILMDRWMYMLFFTQTKQSYTANTGITYKPKKHQKPMSMSCHTAHTETENEYYTHALTPAY